MQDKFLSKMKVLVLSTHLPMPDMSSGCYRFLNILKLLSNHCNCSLMVYDRDGQVLNVGIERYASYRSQIEALSIEVVDNDRKYISRCKFDMVFSEYYNPLRRFWDQILRYQKNAVIVVDSVDLHFRRIYGEAKVKKSIYFLKKSVSMFIREMNTYRKADVVIDISEEEQQLLQKLFPRKNILIIPNIHEDGGLPSDNIKRSIPSTKPHLLFVGNFGHSPNVDAMIYFNQDILPLLRNHFHDILVTIIGASPPEAIKRFNSSTVRVLGHVPDIDPFLYSCHISIAPLRYGAGMKGKIGQAMACGLPVVTTSVGAQGFGLIPGEHVVVGDTPQEFSQGIIKLIEDHDYYRFVRENASRFIDEHYSLAAADRQITNLLRVCDGIA